MIISHLFGHQLGRIYPIRVAFNLLIWVLRKLNIAAEIDGHRMLLGSKIGLGLFAHVIQRPFEIEVFKRQVKKGDVVLDLGACVGYYTLITGRLVGENGRVFAFEPDPSNFAVLEKNIELNNYSNINIVPIRKAVSNKSGEAKLYLNRDDPSVHTLFGEGSQYVEVKTIELDEYLEDYKIDFIKMDIEGAEGKALQGMTSILEKNKNLKILTEFNPFLLKRSGIEPKEFLESLIVKWNFELYHINEEAEELEPITVEKLINKCPVGEYTNLLCLKRNDLENLYRTIKNRKGF